MPAFNWNQFLKLANHLFSNESLSNSSYKAMEQAVLRTLISRSYYAIFKTIEDELNKRNAYKKFKKTEKGGSHSIVIKYLGKCDKKFSSTLERLKNQRIIADYKSKFSLTHRDVKNALNNADNLFRQWPSVLQKIPK